MTEIDGIVLKGPAYALSISDASLPDQMEERAEILQLLSETSGRMLFVRVRDDAMDSRMMMDAVSAAARLGLGLVLESPVLSNLEEAVGCLGGRRPLLSSPDGDQNALAELAAKTGCPVAISSCDMGELRELSAKAAGLGCSDILLDPNAMSMKGCLESNTRIMRSIETGEISEAPICTRGWSGEYALAVSTVSLFSGGSLMILDDLDIEACSILDAVIRNLPPQIG